jgi:hypothetical protein
MLSRNDRRKEIKRRVRVLSAEVIIEKMRDVIQ